MVTFIFILFSNEDITTKRSSDCGVDWCFNAKALCWTWNVSGQEDTSSILISMFQVKTFSRETLIWSSYVDDANIDKYSLLIETKMSSFHLHWHLVLAFGDNYFMKFHFMQYILSACQNIYDFISHKKET